MACVSQKMRSEPACKLRNVMKSSIFNAQQVTPPQSMQHMKRLLAVAISNIAYLRAFFPDTAFGDRFFEEIPMKILRDDGKCPGACGLVKWIHGCFDAIEKKYLRQVILAVYTDPNDQNTVIESYTFQFSYKDELIMDVQRNNERVVLAKVGMDTKKATVSLVRTLIVLMQTLAPLPNKVMVTVKLFYYEDVTPEDYQPDGFKAGNADSFKYSVHPVSIKVGEVKTLSIIFMVNMHLPHHSLATKPFHSLNLRVKVDSAQFEEAKVQDIETGEDNKQEQQQPAAASQVIGERALPSTAENDGSLMETEASQTASEPAHASSSATQLSEAKSLTPDGSRLRLTATPVAVKLEAPNSIPPPKPDEIIDLTDSPPRARLCPLDRIENITKKTNRLSLTKKRIFTSKNHDQGIMENDSTLTKQCMKRVRSLKIETDFEVESPQPSQEDFVYRSVKKRRSSIPNEPLSL